MVASSPLFLAFQKRYQDSHYVVDSRSILTGWSNALKIHLKLTQYTTADHWSETNKVERYEQVDGEESTVTPASASI